MFLNIFTFVVIIVLVAVVGIVVAKLGMLPGKVARERGHPQAEAINIAGWFGIITLGVLWPLALIWAYTRPAGWVARVDPGGDESASRSPATTDEVERLGARLSAVEARLDGLQGDQEASR